MATVRISQLTAITTPTDDDVFIINDADTNTRKISFANLTQGLLNTSSTAQTKTGALTIGGTLTASGNLVVDTNTFFVDATNNRVGVKTTSPATELDVDGTIRVRNANPIQFGDANNSNHVAVKSPGVVAANFTLTLPDALPAVTNLLAVNSAGTMDYSIGVVYNGTDDSLELGLVKLTNQGAVRFFEGTGGGSEYIQFKAPAALATTNTYTLPNAFPAASGYVLSADTSGILSWVSNSASAAGSPGEIQFNSGSGLGADADFVWNSGTNTLQTVNATLTGDLSVDGNYVENGVSTSFSLVQTAVVTATSFDVTIGTATVPNSAKLLIQVVDTITGDIEFYEHFVTQDGSGGISEISGANTQAPTPGTFLSTPTTAVVGANIVCSITNTAISTNDVDIKVQVVATT